MGARTTFNLQALQVGHPWQSLQGGGRGGLRAGQDEGEGLPLLPPLLLLPQHGGQVGRGGQAAGKLGGVWKITAGGSSFNSGPGHRRQHRRHHHHHHPPPRQPSPRRHYQIHFHLITLSSAIISALDLHFVTFLSFHRPSLGQRVTLRGRTRGVTATVRSTFLENDFKISEISFTLDISWLPYQLVCCVGYF